jgi:hypothetical protein
MKYYKTNSRKISFREYWHISRGTGFLIAWFNKAFGIPMNFIAGIPEPQAFRDKIIERNLVPPTIFEKLNSGVLDLQQIEFDEFLFYTLKNSLTTGLGYGVQALHPSHKTMSKVLYVSYKNRERSVLAFLSELNDGTILGTTNKKQDFNTPPKHIIQRRLGASARELWELHQKKLAEMNRSNPPKIFANFDQVAAFEDKFLRMSYDDKIRRGIWVEMTDAEVAASRSKRIPPPIPS